MESIPAGWSLEEWEYNRSDGSWCALSIILHLTATSAASGCLCHNVTVKALREATAADEHALDPVWRRDA